jgi:hypothetical protein
VGTLKADALTLNRTGTVVIVFASIVVLLLFLSGEFAKPASWPDDLYLPLFFGAMGGAALAFNAMRLPGWARERDEQMDYIVARARALIGA